MKFFIAAVCLVSGMQAMHENLSKGEWKVVQRKGKYKDKPVSYSKSQSYQQSQLGVISTSSLEGLRETLEELYEPKAYPTRNQKKRARNRAAQKRKKEQAIAPEKYSAYLAVYNDGPYDC